jgi:DNA-directed RNA polymerase specialized sigma24 family protein
VARKSARAGKLGEPVSAEEKIARALGLLLVRNLEQKNEQVTLLRSIGFEVPDIAAMLGMTENHVNVAAFRARKKTGKKSA